MRLWGKIYGINKDFYVAEGEKDAAAAGEPSPELEPRGTGINKYAYWVTDSVTSDWMELPDATPTTIKLARMIKRQFTGNGDAEVVCNPFFAGKEKELLRAQIARITQATLVVPKGLFKLQDDNPRDIIDVPEEQKQPLNFEQLSKLEGWCHLIPHILKVI